MRLLNILRQKKSGTEQHMCVKLSESDECSTVTKIRSLQEQLDSVEDKINKLSNIECEDIQEVVKFFTDDNFLFVCRNLGCYGFTYNDIESICFAISNIENIDKFLEEIRNVYNREKLISQARGEAIAIKDDISAAKKELGIR